MSEILDFKNKKEFYNWLNNNHDCGYGVTLFIYKKTFNDLGIGYEDAVRTALCFGWIDSVVHSHDKIKYKQYYSKRKRNSNWSISNIKRMKDLIANNEVTEFGLELFDITLIDKLDDLIAEEKKKKESKIVLPEYIEDIFKEYYVLNKYYLLSKSIQMMYLDYIEDAKKEETRIRRARKIAKNIKEEN